MPNLAPSRTGRRWSPAGVAEFSLVRFHTLGVGVSRDGASLLSNSHSHGSEKLDAEPAVLVKPHPLQLEAGLADEFDEFMRIVLV